MGIGIKKGFEPSTFDRNCTLLVWPRYRVSHQARWQKSLSRGVSLKSLLASVVNVNRGWSQGVAPCSLILNMELGRRLNLWGGIP